MRLADHQDLRCCEFGIRVMLTTQPNKVPAPLGHTVAKVFSIAPEPKMFWIAAGRVVARVANQPVTGLRIACQRISDPTCNKIQIADAKFAVTECVALCLPRPAIIIAANVDLRPKPIIYRRRRVVDCRQNGAKPQPHAALACSAGDCQGSTASRTSICSSEMPSSIECRHPVVRKIWIARGRDGLRTPDRISDA